jgi:hypothetical protein
MSTPFGSQDTRRFLLDLTRHTPRDFITLLNYIQSYAEADKPLKEAQISSAARGYSVDYFVPEVKDELHGYLAPEEIDHVISLLSGLGKREFTYPELMHLEDRSSRQLGMDLSLVLRHLFECSALGTLDRRGGKTFFTVKYRNRNAVLDLAKTLILHRGMWKALNLA